MTHQPQYTQAATEFLVQPTQQAAAQQPNQFAESASIQRGSLSSVPQRQPAAGIQSEIPGQQSVQSAAERQTNPQTQAVAEQTMDRQLAGQQAAEQQMVGQQGTEQQMVGQQATEQQLASQPQQASQLFEGQRPQSGHQPAGQFGQPQTRQLIGSSAQTTGSAASVPGAAAQQSGMQRASSQMAPTQRASAQMASTREAAAQGGLTGATGLTQGASLGTAQQTQAGSEVGPIQKTGVPPIDVIDGETELTILADVPGFEEDDIDIKLEGDSLQIVASERVPDLSETESMVGQERPTAVRRQIRLPMAVVVEDAEASYEDGVLSVELPKDEDEAVVGKQIGIQ